MCSMDHNLAGVLVGKVCIIGIGNTLRGDDGAGPLLVKCLQSRVQETVLDVGEEPLNYVDVIESSGPDTILVFDAAELGENPGAIERLNLEDLSKHVTISTHSIPLYQILKLIEMRTHAELVVFGVQAGSLHLGGKMTRAFHLFCGCRSDPCI